MGYLLSDFLPYISSDIKDSIAIRNEREFERFSRITSVKDKTACVFIGDESYLKKLCSNISMIVTTPKIAEVINNDYFGLCICDFPKLLYFRALNYLNSNLESNQGKTIIGSNCSISNLSNVYSNGVVIGNNVTIEDFSVIYPGTIIDDGTVIRSGAKVGIQDYNYYAEATGLVHVTHSGGVKIGKNVEIGYNSVVGRGLYNGDYTKIGDNAKISHNCCIGHDVQLGTNTMIYSGAVLGGYTIVEDGAHITMNATLKNGIEIGKSAMVCMGSNVIMNVRENTKVFGNPAKKLEL